MTGERRGIAKIQVIFHAILCQNASTSLSCKVGSTVEVLEFAGLRLQVSADVKIYGKNRACVSSVFIVFVYTSGRENV